MHFAFKAHFHDHHNYVRNIEVIGKLNNVKGTKVILWVIKNKGHLIQKSKQILFMIIIII